MIHDNSWICGHKINFNFMISQGQPGQSGTAALPARHKHGSRAHTWTQTLDLSRVLDAELPSMPDTDLSAFMKKERLVRSLFLLECFDNRRRPVACVWNLCTKKGLE